MLNQLQKRCQSVHIIQNHHRRNLINKREAIKNQKIDLITKIFTIAII